MHSWHRQRARIWDSALKGKSSLREALARRLFEEQSVIQGFSVVQVLWDLQKFFDSIDPLSLIRAAGQHGMPAFPLTMLLQVHLGLRRLLVNGWIGSSITVRSSILQGCCFSVTCARDIVYDILDRMHFSLDYMRISQHVDDIVQTIIGTQSTLAELSCDHVAKLARLFTQERLVVSSKTRVLASHADVGRRVVATLRSCGIASSLVRSGKDVGVDAAVGVRRATQVTAARSHKSHCRAGALIRLRR